MWRGFPFVVFLVLALINGSAQWGQGGRPLSEGIRDAMEATHNIFKRLVRVFLAGGNIFIRTYTHVSS